MARQLSLWILSLVVIAGVATPSAARVKEEVEHRYPITAGGWVSVQNVNGDIVIETWDQNEVKILAVKKADNRDELADIGIEIHTTKSSIEISTDLNDRRNRWWNFWSWFDGNGSVDYTITVPRNVHLEQIRTVNGSLEISGTEESIEASSVNGSIRITEARGTLNVSTVNGSVTVKFSDISDSDWIHVNTVNGAIRITIPDGSDAHIAAKSINGGIRSDIQNANVHRYLVGRSFNARLGDGDTSIKLRTVNGGIHIKQSSDNQRASR